MASPLHQVLVFKKRKAVGNSCEASVVIDGSVPWLDITMGATAELGGQWTQIPSRVTYELSEY